MNDSAASMPGPGSTPCPSGLLIIDKPAGWTSMDVCARVRALVRRGGAPKRSKVGHAGTLDPFATGLLVVLVGKATRLSNWLMTGEKEYTAEIDLSRVSDTQDPTGTIRPVDVDAVPGAGDVERAAAGLTGLIQQRPPIHSAMSVGGVRAYHLARRGEISELPARPVTVHEFRIDSFQWPEVRVFIRCGKGTYIRSLARDLGTALGVGGMLTSLRRLRVGEFSVDLARSMDSLPSVIGQADLLPMPVVPDDGGDPEHASEPDSEAGADD